MSQGTALNFLYALGLLGRQWCTSARYQKLIASLERVLISAPDHPPALHLYIHAVAAFSTPARVDEAYIAQCNAQDFYPAMYYPSRQSLGQALLLAERNDWSLSGLVQTLHKQGKSAEANRVKDRFDRIWQFPGIRLQGSQL
ncbi:hypothetical protein A9Q89_05960 [Gammaproteobacteria bacterium 53_120_T64]|nr:hypothetical protein A9Q89_05960 [Gammaproteobacteria bacterium 53_120_T64]